MKKAKILVVAPYEGMREVLTGIAEQRWVMDGDTMTEELTSRGFEVDLQYADLDVGTQITRLRT